MGLRKYARHRERLGLDGGTLRAVQVAIKTGRLSGSLTTNKRIKTAKGADVEWAASTKADMVPLTGPTAPKNGHANGASPPPVNELAGARARREGVNADLAEIELAEKRGELVLARDVEARVADAFLRCRTRLLGTTVRAREADPTITEAQHRLYETLLREALEELAGVTSG